MVFLRYEIVNPASFLAGEQVFGKICHFIRLRHIAGAGDAEISFSASGAAAQVILSPSGGTPYPQEVQMEMPEGVDRVRINAPAATVEVTAWR